MSRVDIIQSDPTVPVGVFGALLAEWQVPFHICRPGDGEPLPAPGRAVIVLGGTMGVHDTASHPFLLPVKNYMSRVVAAGVPLLGICLGGQLLAEVSGGLVNRRCCGEQGLVDIELTAAGLQDPLFAGINRRFRAFQWHNDSFTVPPGALHLAASTKCPGQGFRIGNAWGLQFHPEVDREIVADWARHNPSRSAWIAAFAVQESSHAELAGRILRNFLDVARRTG